MNQWFCLTSIFCFGTVFSSLLSLFRPLLNFVWKVTGYCVNHSFYWQFEPNAIETWEHPDIKVQYSEERCCSNIQIFIAPQCCKMYPWPCGKRNLCGRYQSKEFIFHVHYTSVEKALEILKKISSQTWRQ